MEERKLPEIKRARKLVTQPGLYELLLVHIEPDRSKATDKRYSRCTFIAEGEVIVYGFLVWPEDSDTARWVWENVIEHPRDLEPGMIFYTRVKHEVWRDETRNRIGALYATAQEVR